MKRLKRLAICVSLGAASPVAYGADGDPQKAPTASQAPAQPATPVAVRPEPPAPPKKYLETGALLFNRKRYDLAAKYLDAAQKYRDRLTLNEQIVLDEYSDQIERYRKDQKTARETPAVDPSLVTASTVPPPVLAPPPLDMSGKQPGTPPAESAPGQREAERAALPSTELLRDTPDAKQNARWQLQMAREQIALKHFEAAEKLVAEVRSMNVKWGYFDDTPDKVAETLAKLKAKEGAITRNAANASLPRDRRTARLMLRDARVALEANQFDKADAIAREVQSWNLRYGLFDDTPEKVAEAAADAHRRASVRDAELSVKTYAEQSAASTTVPTPASPASR